jgi:serine protease Do
MASLVLACCVLGVSAFAQPAANQKTAINLVFEKLKPSLVRVEVVVVDHRQGRETKQEGAGSGTIISPEGHVITNHHVAGRTRRITCTLADREEVDAELLGTDALSDISILKLRPTSARTFPAAAFGDSSRLAVGDSVLAMGSPFALSQSVTLGIVSNVEMTMPRLLWPFNRLELEGEDVGSLVRWIGHDAPIFGGNSGGPLVNLDGEIVGVNEISLGLAGAIPGNLARDVAEAIIKHGRVVRSWIGLEAQPLLRSSAQERGVLVGGAIEGSPAQAAGFETGDILLRLAGRDVSVRFAEELPLFNQAVMRLPRGQPVEAVVLRGGLRKTLRVLPVERENVESRPRELPAWGVTASNLTSWTAKELRRRNSEGVRVRGVRPGGAAHEAKPPIREDDVIVKLDGVAVRSVEALAEHTERLLAGGATARSALVGFERGPESYLTVVELGRPRLDDPGLEARKPSLPGAVQVLTRELAEKLGMPGQTGVRVTRLDATAAGLQLGDVIIAVDDDPVRASQPGEIEVFSEMLRRHRIGARVELTVLRDGQSRRVPMQLEASPRSQREMKRFRVDDFDFRVRDLAAADRWERGLEAGAGGVVVDAVGEGGWAALAQLAEGDVVLSIDGRVVRDSTTVQARMAEVVKEKPRAVVLHVRRGIRMLFIEMQAGWSR